MIYGGLGAFISYGGNNALGKAKPSECKDLIGIIGQKLCSTTKVIVVQAVTLSRRCKLGKRGRFIALPEPLAPAE